MQESGTNSCAYKTIHTKLLCGGKTDKYRKEVKNSIANSIDDHISAGRCADHAQCTKKNTQTFQDATAAHQTKQWSKNAGNR